MIHCAFDHSAFGNDFSKFLAVCEKDRCAIEALGDALNGLLLDLPRPPTCVWSSLKPWWMKRLKTSEWGPVRAYVEKPGVRVAHCQPKNRGTAPPILYSLLSIQQINDDAIVALFNSALQSALTLSALGRLCVDQAVQSRPLVPPIDLGGQV